MHECSSGSLLIVNAGVDSMGGVIDGGVEISSAPSPQQSSDLEKTQAELRETFSAAEKFRRELEYLQKGGDPLDFKFRTAASVSLQFTSLTDQHPEQLVTSEVKGSFGATASPHGDSVESSGRLAAPSVGEPNSADNLMLFDGDNKFREVERSLELPKKSYKRRIRSRANRDGARSSSTDAGPHRGHSIFPSPHASSDAKGLVHDVDNQDQKYMSKSNSNPKSQLQEKSTRGPSYDPVSAVSDASASQHPQENLSDQPFTSVSSIERVEQETRLHVSENTKERTNDCNGLLTKGFNSKSSCSQTDQCNNENEVPTSIRNVDSKGTMELNLASNMEGNNLNTVKDDLEVATKEHEDSILEEARIIEEKHKRIAGLSVGILTSETRHRSHWNFVLEEMLWLANDFAQERLWKVTASAQISRGAAYASHVRFQQQNLLWKQKEVARILAETVMEFWRKLQLKCQALESEDCKRDSMLGLHRYGMRFLEFNSPYAQYNSAQAPVTPDRISDLGSIEILWEDNLTEENLFYTVPPGAIEVYRKSIESHLLQCERTGSSMQREVDAFESHDNTLEEDDGETSTYYLPKTTQKKRKHFKSYEREADIGNQLSVLSGKRPAASINASIPTKRVRTASRQRFIGASGYIQNPNRTDASSGDTNSFQDEQSSLHGGSHIPNNMEAESGMMEVSNRLKKKKKANHSGSTFEHRWQQNDQKDHSKRRLDNRLAGSISSPVASQMSNTSNPNKFMKLLVRDHGRKAISLKTPVGQPGQQGSGSPWSLFEDQALVVLVHDMGANWELISDAINSILQFKCICRNSKECKDRHKLLMDMSAGDDAQDSGSSQRYPSTLPGIPEGSARQLFQRLQGPMEEDTLKSHFDKIIMISQKQHYRKIQKDNQDPKQLQQPHGSHALALSQVVPNNLNGGPVLTPLDLYDAISSGPDFIPVGYQAHNGGLPLVPGSSSAASAPLSPSVREGRHGIPRTGSLSLDKQYRLQHYNHMPPGSNRSMLITRPEFQGNAVRPREALHVTRPNQNTDHQRQIMAADLQMQQVQSYPRQSPHMPNSNSHPAYEMRIMKERQLQQQRLLRQQIGISSNPMMPHAQPQQSPLPVSSPQSSTQILSPIGMNPASQHPQKHPVPAPRHHPPQQIQQPGRMNGQQQVVHRLQGNLYSGPSGVKQPMPPHSSLNPSPQPKRYPGQPQAVSSKQPQQLKPQPHPKLVNTSEPLNDSSATQFRKVPEHSKPPAVNHGGVHKESSLDSLPTQWQQQPSS